MNTHVPKLVMQEVALDSQKLFSREIHRGETFPRNVYAKYKDVHHYLN